MFVLNKPGEIYVTNSAADIAQSVYLLCSCQKGEIPYNPELGLERMVETEGLDIQRRRLEIDVSRLLKQYEPRAKLVGITAAEKKATIAFTVETSLELLETEVNL